MLLIYNISMFNLFMSTWNFVCHFGWHARYLSWYQILCRHATFMTLFNLCRLTYSLSIYVDMQKFYLLMLTFSTLMSTYNLYISVCNLMYKLLRNLRMKGSMHGNILSIVTFLVPCMLILRVSLFLSPVCCVST